VILALIVLFTLLGSLGSVGLAGLLLLLKGERLRFVTGGMVPYAIGTLLGAAFFGMIPHALLRLASTVVLPTVLSGIILFYVLEKFALWRHCHEESCAVHTRAGTMILIGDSLHNFVDGVAIAVAFAGSIPLGIATSVAVIAHEVPQEVGDFVILLESGYARSRAFWFNTLSSLAALPGAVISYLVLPVVQSLVPYLLSVSAASFIYIALADLVPGRRGAGGLRSLAWELPLIGLGAGTIVALRLNAGW
jgi:zinc and cadmium transporter